MEESAYKGACTVRFHLSEVGKEAKLIYAVTNRALVALGMGLWAERDQEGLSWGPGNNLCLDLGPD